MRFRFKKSFIGSRVKRPIPFMRLEGGRLLKQCGSALWGMLFCPVVSGFTLKPYGGGTSYDPH